jgi:hypothetical protein
MEYQSEIHSRVTQNQLPIWIAIFKGDENSGQSLVGLQPSLEFQSKAVAFASGHPSEDNWLDKTP